MSSPQSHASTSSVYGALVALISFGTLLAAGCGGDEAQQTDAGYALGAPIEDSTVAATAEAKGVRDTLAYADMERGLNQLTGGRYPTLADSTQKQVQRFSLDRFISNAALVAEARERGHEADSSAVAQELQQLRARLKAQSRGQASLQQQLERSGMTMADLRSTIGEQVMVRKLQETLAEDAEAPTAQEISDYRNDQAREIRTQQILFPVSRRSRQGQRDSVRMRARNVLDSIQSGAADFSAMAQRYGQASGAEGGEEGGEEGGSAGGAEGGSAGGPSSSGYQSRGELAGPSLRRGQDPASVPLVQTAFALQDSGAVADEPVRTPRGFVLLRQTGSRTGTLMDSTQAAQQLTVQQRQKVVEDAIKELRKNVTLRINPDHVTADMTQTADSSGQGGGAQSEGA